MRSFSCLVLASLLSLAPRLASAQEAPPPAPQTVLAAPEAPPPFAPMPPAAPPTVIVLTPPGPPPAAPPMWYAPPMSDAVVMHRRNEKLMVAGLVMVPVGIAMAVGGGVLVHNIDSKPSTCQAPSSPSLGGAIATTFCDLGTGIGRAMDLTGAYTLAIMGGGIGLAGVVMATVGGQMVPQKRARPAVRVGAGSVALSWSF